MTKCGFCEHDLHEDHTFDGHGPEKKDGSTLFCTKCACFFVVIA